MQVGLADTPAGPYTIVNHNVTLKYRIFTSSNIFVDRPLVRLTGEGESEGADTVSDSGPLAAYVMYSSFAAVPLSDMATAAVVERLDDTWTRTVTRTHSLTHSHSHNTHTHTHTHTHTSTHILHSVI